MSVLGRKEILSLRETGELIIEPFNSKNLSPNSYDVTLGENFWVFDEVTHVARASLANAYSQKETKALFKLVKALPAQKHTGVWYPQLQEFSRSDLLFLLPPHGTVLAHTVEFIGSASSQYCTMLKTRSSWTRLGVSFTGTAGWGDSGFFGRWGMRIVNHTSYYLPLLIGSRVAQIVFLRSSDKDQEEMLYNGKYQNSSTTIEQLKSSWTPESLLPQMWKDLQR
jgi:deoxycytidine triphosphate deaminase